MKWISLLFLIICKISFGEIKEFYTGVRRMAMGGASIAVVNDETALLSNPAALGKLRNSFLTVADPEFHGSTDARTIYSRMAGGLTDARDMDGLLQAAKQRKGKHWHTKMQLFPSIVFPNFGFGAFVKEEWDAEVNEELTNYNFNYIQDAAFVFGLNLSFFDGRIKLGAGARVLNRVETHQDLDPNPETGTTYLLDDYVKEGVGVGTDLGLIMTAPWMFLPTISAVARDFNNTSFPQTQNLRFSSSERPDTVYRSIDAGLAFFPIHTKSIRTSITGEYRDVLSASSETFPIRRSHAGLEINFGDIFFLRGGANQGYWTAGLEFVFINMQLQFAAYGEDIGDTLVRKENRRYVGKFAIRF